MASAKVYRLRRRMSFMAGELRQIRRFRYNDMMRFRRLETFAIMTITRSGMTPEAIEELINQRVAEALAAYKVNRAAELAVESQSQNGDYDDNENIRGNGNGNGRGNGDGNGNGGGNGNGNPNRNDKGTMPVAREFTYHDFVKCQPLNFKGTEGRELMKLMTEVYCPRNDIQKMQTELWNLTVKGNDLVAYTVTPVTPHKFQAFRHVFRPGPVWGCNIERMNYHVTTTLSIPRSHMHALSDLNWQKAMVDEYNALISNATHKFNPDGSLRRHDLSQLKFKEVILERAHMQNCNPCRTHVDTDFKLGPDGELHVCLYMYDPCGPHFTALKRILRYVRGTIDYGPQHHVLSTTQLTAYTDVDWVVCPLTRRSTSEYYVFLGDNLLSWFAKRQVTLSRYSAKAEYCRVANVVAEAAWIRNLLRELHTPLFTAILVYCDNVSVIYISTNPV
ncbi:ribonuclease H-like domain-containing protein [Tanacetum coccineum]